MYNPSVLKTKDLAIAEDTSHYAETLPENPGFFIRKPTITGSGKSLCIPFIPSDEIVAQLQPILSLGGGIVVCGFDCFDC